MPDPLTPEHFRLFVAVTLPEAVKGVILEVQREFRNSLLDADIRWTRPDQFHLTLRFLGNVDSSRVADLTNALLTACRGFPALNLHAEGIGCFPNARSPRVLWIGVDDTSQRLAPLQAAVQAATLDFTAEEPEKRFTGHLTLARIKRIRPKEARRVEELVGRNGGRFFGRWTANAVELIRSELSAQGARYTTLVDAGLGG